MTTQQTPRNASEALAQANRLQRAKQVLAAGYHFRKDRDFDIIAVFKPGYCTAAYWIKDGKCDCPDSQKGRECKHWYAWELLQEQAQDAATVQAFEEQKACLQSGLPDCLLPSPFDGEPADALLDAQAHAVLQQFRVCLLAELKMVQNKVMQINPFDNAAQSWRRRADRTADALTVFDRLLFQLQIGQVTLTDGTETDTL